jgi:ubiquinol-cytochrome c reductase iron-sulfur subunit
LDRDVIGGGGRTLSDRTDRPRSTTPILAALGLSAAASLGLTIVYVSGGQPQIEGALLFVSLGGIGVALIAFAHRFLPLGRAVEERGPLGSTAADREWAELSLEGGAERIGRRRAIVGLLAAALGALGLAALFPIRSLGRAPGASLFRTSWRPGSRAVTGDGTLVLADSVLPGAFLTVFPEGFAGSADSQAVLIGIDPALNHPLPGRSDWLAGRAICYSKICTHAGCPVGLYLPGRHELFCPCHQSVFAILDGARPVGGPAARALPQLPIAIDAEGYVVATGDFPEPVGPGFWDLPR